MRNNNAIIKLHRGRAITMLNDVLTTHVSFSAKLTCMPFTVAFRGIGNHLDFQTMRLTTPAHRILEFATSQRATPMQRAVGTGRLRQSRLPAEWVEQTIDVEIKQVPRAGLLSVKMLSWQ